MNYDRVILELLDRVAALESEVAKIKEVRLEDDEGRESQPTGTQKIINVYSGFLTPGTKDTTRYLLGGNVYGKNRLVLAVIQAYVAEHPNVSANELMAAFDRRLQGTRLGVVRKLDELKQTYPDYQRRFFASPDEVIHTSSEDCVVCTQWGKFNIDNFIRRATHLGFDIEAV